jgi:tetratricopeptide (TPR) repeat protein
LFLCISVSISRDKLVREAQRLVARKKFDKAIDVYRKVVSANPKDVRTLLKIGDLYLKLSDHERAVSTYEQVGEYYYREGFSVKAIAVYKQIRGIIERHASHLSGRYSHIVPRLAEIYAQLGLTSDALAAYDEVASGLRAHGHERDALDMFIKIVGLDPQNPIAHLRVADSRARLGEIDVAVEGFGEAAQLMVKLGRHDDALKVLERLLECRADPKWARLAGQLYLDRGGATDGMVALSKLQICFKADPKDLSTLAILARAFDVIGQPKKAVEVLKESARIARADDQHDAFAAILDTLLERAPDDTMVRQMQQRRVARETGRPPPPETDIEIDLEDMSIDESMSEVFELTDGDINTLCEEISSMELFAPESTGEGTGIDKVLDDVDAYCDAGHLDIAIEALRSALHAFGDSPPIRKRLIDLLLEADKTDDAIGEKLLLATQLGAENDFSGALRHVTEILSWTPQHIAARELHRQLSMGLSEAAPPVALPVAPPSVRGRAGTEPMFDAAPAADDSHQSRLQGSLEEAESLAGQGQLDEARTVLERELEQRPDHPIILSHLSDLAALERGSQPPSSSAGFIPHPADLGAPTDESGALAGGQVRARQDVADDDYHTHYELAVAYREMGQLDQAIDSLRVAAHDAKRECVCLFMISQIQLQRGEQDAALDSLHAALAAQHRTRDEELTVGYEIGQVYETRDMPEQALQYFEWVAMIHPDHTDPRGDITERIQRLRGGSGPLRLPLSRKREADEA